MEKNNYGKEEQFFSFEEKLFFFLRKLILFGLLRLIIFVDQFNCQINNFYLLDQVYKFLNYFIFY